ncbi:hypothetical protein EV356DRAFT_448090 [Viridothelium virens]|uniref:FAM192A/Fyv6 N-terminal domain-containing protein n=1 Tax=Viridothelium virens TaxID=1048519 RepID=A0A6A6H7T2_VIRVR|nr:hypothetical protein EV356DRAFT_448090 [Viridothelium virens]
MSSGFVSGGTIDNPVERDDEWLQAQKELDSKRLREKEEKAQAGGKSLFETLQANKAAKQEAFEESIKLKNQFRSLDEHEAEFLDSVLNTTRAKEDALRRETSEQLESFRKQQEQAQKPELAEGQGGSPVTEQEHWVAGPRKRKREKDVIPGVKLRKSSSGAQNKSDSNFERLKEGSLEETPPGSSESAAKSTDAQSQKNKPESSPLGSSTNPIRELQTSKSQPATSEKLPAASSTGLGLGDYSSDEAD